MLQPMQATRTGSVGVALRSNVGPATYVRGGPQVDAEGVACASVWGYSELWALWAACPWPPWLRIVLERYSFVHDRTILHSIQDFKN